jgi:DNA-binding Lrp family transcriptional regulator
MGRPPTVTNDELVAALQTVLDWPSIAAIPTETVADELDATQPTALNRLKSAREDDTVPITGFQVSERGGYVWWLTDADLY